MGIDLKLFLNKEGVSALRDLGDSIPYTTKNIISSTEKVVQVYQAVSENVGPHTGDFAEMLYSIKRYMDISDESLEIVRAGVYKTADKIEEYLNDNGSGATTILAGNTFDIKQEYSSNTEIFNKEKAVFTRGCVGVLDYSPAEVQRNIFITEGMFNDNRTSATKNLSTCLRVAIQENAIANKLKEDEKFFEQFGCEEKTPSSIRSWFSDKNKSIYTLHETNVNTVQIVYSEMHDFWHVGGVSKEKANLISADNRNN